MNASVLRLYYNRKSAPKSRPPVITELSSKLDRTNAPFVMNDVPTSPFELDLKFADIERNNDNNNHINIRDSMYINFNRGSQPQPMTTVRNFSTRVFNQQDHYWVQPTHDISHNVDTTTYSYQLSSDINRYNETSSFEEAKTGSQERDSVHSEVYQSNPPPAVEQELSHDHLVCTLQALSHMNDWKGCMELIRNSNKSSACDFECYTVAMQCCSAASGQTPNSSSQVFSATPADECVWLVQDMRSRFNYQPSQEMVALAMSALVKAGRPIETVQFFGRLKKAYAQALSQALKACTMASKHNLGNENWAHIALQIFHAHKAKADLQHYNIMLSVLAAGGHLKQALEFVDDMRLNSSIGADDHTWSTLLWACSTAQCIGGEDEPDGALVAMELFATLKKNGPAHHMTSHVYVAALRAATGVTGPSYPDLSAPPPEIRVDFNTGQGLTLTGFKIKYGPKVGLEVWKSCEASNVIGMWRAMLSARHFPPVDVVGGVLNFIVFNNLVVAGRRILSEITGDSNCDRGWRADCIKDDACFDQLMVLVQREPNCRNLSRKLLLLRSTLLEPASSQSDL